jgi:hypothetical protein
MLLQTNSYIVPAEKRVEHQRLLKRFRQVMIKLGCDSFDTFEQVGPNWAGNETTGRFVQIMRFRDHQHQRGVQAAERSDPTAQALIAEFCDLINLPYQQQQGLFAIGFYRTVVGSSGAAQHATQREEVAPEGYEQAAEGEPVAEAQVEEPVETAYGVPQEHEAVVEAHEEVSADFVTEEAPVEAEGAGNNDPASLEEFDIEAIAEEEIGGFEETPGDAEEKRR